MQAGESIGRTYTSCTQAESNCKVVCRRGKRLKSQINPDSTHVSLSFSLVFILFLLFPESEAAVHVTTTLNSLEHAGKD